jgi:hypothetical protein
LRFASSELRDVVGIEGLDAANWAMATAWASERGCIIVVRKGGCGFRNVKVSKIKQDKLVFWDLYVPSGNLEREESNKSATEVQLQEQSRA